MNGFKQENKHPDSDNQHTDHGPERGQTNGQEDSVLNYDTIKNLPDMFFTQAEKFGDAPFLWTKRDGSWQSQSWSEISARVSALSRGLRASGVKAGDRVVILSENRPAWFISDLAIMSAGAISVPAYTTNTVEDHLHILSDSGAKVAIISGNRLAKNFMPAAMQTDLDLVITMDPIDHKPAQSVSVRTFEEMEDLGRSQPDDVRDQVNGLKRSDTCCLIYTLRHQRHPQRRDAEPWLDPVQLQGRRGCIEAPARLRQGNRGFPCPSCP